MCAFVQQCLTMQYFSQTVRDGMVVGNSPYRLLLASCRCQFFSKPGYTSWHLSSGFRDQRSSRVRGCRKPFNSMLQCTSSYMLLHGQVADTPTRKVDSPTSQLKKESEVTDSEVSSLTTIRHVSFMQHLKNVQTA